MAESRASSTPPTPPPAPSATGISPSPASGASATPGIGTIVLVRSTINSLAPAIITNDYGGSNAPGVVSLIVFNASTYDNSLVKSISQAQAETPETLAQDLANDLFGYWQPIGSSLAKRDLQKEIDDKAKKDQEAAEKAASASESESAKAS